MLNSDEIPGMEVIAAQHGVDRSYISLILGLTMLAPDLTEAALKGNEPTDVSLRMLMANLPTEWDEQRQIPGVPRT